MLNNNHSLVHTWELIWHPICFSSSWKWGRVVVRKLSISGLDYLYSMVCLMVFNATFNKNSVISCWSRYELTTSMVIGTDCIGRCKSNYHTIMTMTTSFIFCSNMTSFKRFESKPVVKIILIYDRLNLWRHRQFITIFYQFVILESK